ncbi:hypothetical protein EDM53_03470 [Rickettsiales endosymbiont of Peranema trichophorum]|uniref:hypothetical protein n=1 Tax=Rickettsiales endosymbiont of Peranema trichophorum TaxID=2486577 RepID=UPI001023D76B|nr:hypothetical protein [Rickettsiales endosymbiont of Peranema trichophorum]RZI46972.1 hypothetical protein EDM53_03470 [Rickettsiales endosymbiont of Peranema trichophorum]
MVCFEVIKNVREIRLSDQNEQYGAILLVRSELENARKRGVITVKTLNLYGNNIDDGALNILVPIIKAEIPYLSVLNIGGNKIGYDIDANSIAKLGELLLEDSALTHLNLEGNTIGDPGAISLSAILTRNHALKHLNLGSNMIGVDGATAILEAVSNIRHFETLILRNNNIGAYACELFGSLFKSSNIQVLDLQRNKIGDAIAKVPISDRDVNTALHSLDLSHNGITYRSALHIVEMLCQCTRSLRQLKLSSNQMGDEGMACLSDILSRRTAITHFELDNNDIGDKGIKLFAENIATYGGDGTKILTYLSLQHNGITNDGFTHLMAALSSNDGLTHLDLSSNKIVITEGTSDAVITLGGMILSNSAIKEIHLDGNEFDEDIIMKTSQCDDKQSTIPDTLPYYIEQSTSLEVFHISHQRSPRMTPVKAILERNAFIRMIKETGKIVLSEDRVEEIVYEVHARYSQNIEEKVGLFGEEVIEKAKRDAIEENKSIALKAMMEEHHERLKTMQKSFQGHMKYHNPLFNRDDVLELLQSAYKYGGPEGVDFVIEACSDPGKYEVLSKMVSSKPGFDTIGFLVDVYKLYGEAVIDKMLKQYMSVWEADQFLELWEEATAYKASKGKAGGELLLTICSVGDEFLILHRSLSKIIAGWKLKDTLNIGIEASIRSSPSMLEGMLIQASKHPLYRIEIGEAIRNEGLIFGVYKLMGKAVFSYTINIQNIHGQFEKLIVYQDANTGETLQSELVMSTRTILHLNSDDSLERQFHQLIQQAFNIPSRDGGALLGEVETLINEMRKHSTSGCQTDKEIGMLWVLNDLLRYLKYDGSGVLWPFRFSDQGPPYGLPEASDGYDDFSQDGGSTLPMYGGNNTWE